MEHSAETTVELVIDDIDMEYSDNGNTTSGVPGNTELIVDLLDIGDTNMNLSTFGATIPVKRQLHIPEVLTSA